MLRSYAVEPVDDASGTEEEGQEPTSGTRTPYFLLSVSLLALSTFLVSGTVLLRNKSRQTKSGMHNEPIQKPGPPLPPGGLPDGWTLEQWYYYGEEYLRGER